MLPPNTFYSRIRDWFCCKESDWWSKIGEVFITVFKELIIVPLFCRENCKLFLLLSFMEYNYCFNIACIISIVNNLYCNHIDVTAESPHGSLLSLCYAVPKILSIVHFFRILRSIPVSTVVLFRLMIRIALLTYFWLLSSHSKLVSFQWRVIGALLSGGRF